MTNKSRVITAAVVVTTCSVAKAFIPRPPVGKSFSATPASSARSRVGSESSQHPQTRGDNACAVGPLNLFGISLLDVANDFIDLVTRDTHTCLPQDDQADQAARSKQLEEQRELYTWSYEGIPVGTPYLKELPKAEVPALEWISKVIASLLKILTGTVRGKLSAVDLSKALFDPESAADVMNTVSELIKGKYKSIRADNIDDYERLHSAPISTPESVYDFEDDDTFARLRLQGGNCVVLEKCTAATRAKLKALDSDPEYATLKTKVDSLMDAGKLFVVDHELLAGMPAMPSDGWTRYLTPSVALFEYVDDDELLPIRPIGIQLGQGEEVLPIFMPGEGNNWKIAKACFEAADFIIHEIVSHLGNTHLVLEAPMVAMNRQLPKEHPIYDLLKPHFEGTAFINDKAQSILMVHGGPIDGLQANDINDSLELVRIETQKRVQQDFSPEADFKNRGVTKEEFPGLYMYRDVGTLYWEATHTWVTEYLSIYYSSDQDMIDDYELQNFMTEMSVSGEMTWFDDFKTASNKRALVAKILASLIYSASTLHAAVNFPQKPSMSFAPSCPGSVYAPPPTDKSERSDEEYLSYLPPMAVATSQVLTLTLLGSVVHTNLGDYSSENFDDDRVYEPLSKFQDAIEEIGFDLTANNAYIASEWRKRGKGKYQANNFCYTTLMPDKIPQSINI